VSTGRTVDQRLPIGKDDVLAVTRLDLHDDPKLPVYSLRVRKAG
jgi:hypothetical protein